MPKLSGAIVAALLLMVAGCASTRSAGPSLGQRPNIVFILTDDLSMNLVRYMPHVLQMQKSGTTMSKFYVVDSLCCPSRAATLTGEYPHDDGVFLNGGPEGGYDAFTNRGDEEKTFALTLHDAGYRTGFMGKYLNKYTPAIDPPNPGWDVWDGVGPAYREYNYKINENGRVRRYGWTPNDYLTDVLSGKAARFIDSAKSADRPFMLEVATYAPHDPYIPAPRYATALPNTRYPRTPAFNRLPSNPPSWLAPHPVLRAGPINRMEFDYVQRVRADLAVDDLIGRIFSALRKNDLLQNTYVVFNSDNGYHMGEYHLTSGKQTAFDTDIHVPLVVVGPGVPAGRVDDHLAANIDLAPTFDEIAGAPIPVSVDGTSLLPVWHGQRPSQWQQAVLIEHHQPPQHQLGDPDRQRLSAGHPPSYDAVRTANALLVQYVSGELEYYRTDADPYELHNLGAAAPPGLVRALNQLAACYGTALCQDAAQLTR